RNAWAGGTTCENFTGARSVPICSSLRAIGSDCATRAINSPDVDLSTANLRRKSDVGYGLIGDRHRSAGRNRFEEIFGHELRHSDATVRRWIARQITGVHADTVDNQHEVGHARDLDLRPQRIIAVNRHAWTHDATGLAHE